VKLLLDEMLSPAIAPELRSRGHDVESVAGDPDREARSDSEVLALARAEHRAIVTSNLRDFRPPHHEAITPGGPGHFGMIFIPGGYRRTKADTGRIIAALEAILIQHPGEDSLANGEAWLQQTADLLGAVP
jgi:predicted nuclease of predicted toxin-antitoxin system